MIGFDRRLEYLISNWLSGKDANNDIRMMFKENDILCFGDLVGYNREDVDRNGVSSLTTIPPLDRDDLLYLTRMKNSTRISLTKPQIRMILDIINYYEFMYWNGDRALADNPTQWDTKNFEDWKQKGQPTSFVEHTASFTGSATPSTAPEVILNEGIISKGNNTMGNCIKRGSHFEQSRNSK